MFALNTPPQSHIGRFEIFSNSFVWFSKSHLHEFLSLTGFSLQLRTMTLDVPAPASLAQVRQECHLLCPPLYKAATTIYLSTIWIFNNLLCSRSPSHWRLWLVRDPQTVAREFSRWETFTKRSMIMITRRNTLCVFFFVIIMFFFISGPIFANHRSPTSGILQGRFFT